MQAVICNSIIEFNRIERRIHNAMVADGAIQERWADPIIHPSTGKVALPVEEKRMGKHLLDEELVVDLTADWFPEPELEDLLEGLELTENQAIEELSPVMDNILATVLSWVKEAAGLNLNGAVKKEAVVRLWDENNFTSRLAESLPKKWLPMWAKRMLINFAKDFIIEAVYRTWKLEAENAKS